MPRSFPAMSAAQVLRRQRTADAMRRLHLTCPACGRRVLPQRFTFAECAGWRCRSCGTEHRTR